MGSFFDDVDTVFRHGLAGLVAARDDLAWDDRGFIRRAGEGASESAPEGAGPGDARDDGTRPGRVALVSGGGSGHEPLHAGFIGAGMLDAVCPGPVFTSPNARQIHAATCAVDGGAGVVHVVKNYTGDVMNFGVAAQMAGDDGVRVETVLVDDDVATDLGDDGDGPGRRGTAATILVEKACGAAAARGASLDVVADVGRNVARRARSMAVSLTGCAIPGQEPSFRLEPGEMEAGVGIHGERGVGRGERVPAAELVEGMLDRILPAAGDPGRVLLLVNGLGGEAGMELSAVLSLACADLEGRGVAVERVMCGDFVTAWDMTGFSLTVLGVDDDLLDLLDEPCGAPAWTAPAVHRGVPDVSDAARAALPAADSGTERPGLTSWVRRVLDSVDDLTALDREAGDGDFGVNMSAALSPFELPLRGTLHEVFDALAQSYLVRAGGTSGAVFGLFLARVGAALEGSRTFAEADLAAVFRTGLDAVVELGGAKVGDCTVVDAIDPAVRALEDGGDLAAAADAALAGAESTADAAAGKGRASYVGDAGRGVADPGALVMAWFFGEFARA
ncbi:dihydroxyacetone kinase family protein [Corynebacterium sp. 335C]